MASRGSPAPNPTATRWAPSGTARSRHPLKSASLTYTLDSFTPIASVFESAYTVCTHKDFPAKTGLELVGLLRQKPLGYSYGNDGKDGSGYFAAERLFDSLGVHVKSESFESSGRDRHEARREEGRPLCRHDARDHAANQKRRGQVPDYHVKSPPRFSAESDDRRGAWHARVRSVALAPDPGAPGFARGAGG